MDFVQILVDGIRQAIVPATAAYALAAMGLNFHFGYTGLLNFGQAGFMLVGAYGLAITSSALRFGLPWPLGVLVGIIAAVVLALILGLPTLRLRADYLAITTIAAAEILRIVARSGFAEPLTGGVFGLQQYAGGFYSLNPIPGGGGVRYLGPLQVTSSQLFMLLVGWSLVALAALLTWALVRSPWGRVLKSIREDEEAVRSLGKNVYWYKMQALIIGGILGAIGGMVLALANANINVDNYLPVVTFYAYAILILGGPARVFGPIVGSILFWGTVAFTESLLRQAVNAGYIPTNVLATQQIGVIRFVLVGLALMLLMAFRPQGIFGNREEMKLDAR